MLRIIVRSRFFLFWAFACIAFSINALPAHAQYSIGDCKYKDWDTSFCDSGKILDLEKSLDENVLEPLVKMTEQLSIGMYQQLFAIGVFFDAKEQLEAQEDFAALVAEAHKDYSPSKTLCEYGSFTRSLANSEQAVELSAIGLSDILLDSAQGQTGRVSESLVDEIEARKKQFKTTYCSSDDEGGNLGTICEESTNSRPNNDINLSRVLFNPLSLDINFQSDDITADEEDIITIGKRLYWQRPVNINKRDKQAIMRLRQAIARNMVAQNSYIRMVAAKTASPGLSSVSGPAFMKAMLQDLGVADVNAMFGENMSYYAQMEVLAKKLYQNPDFYTNLYDKPVNVERINAALEAIQLMHMRDRYNSNLRQEMLISQILERGIIDNAELYRQ